MADRRLPDNLNRLVKHPPKPAERLAPVADPGALPGRFKAAPGAGGDASAGIASPLTEQPGQTIEVVKTITVTGSDAEIDLAQMTDVTFLDADGRAVRFILLPDSRPLPVPPAA